MSEAIISIRGTEVQKTSYKNTFAAKQGERMNIDVKTNVAVKQNLNSPTDAAVFVRFEATEKSGALAFVLETITTVKSSTYVDDFEGVIKKDYVPVIMLAVNEKIRAITSVIGLNINTPPIAFGGQSKSEDDENIISFDGRKK